MASMARPASGEPEDAGGDFCRPGVATGVESDDLVVVIECRLTNMAVEIGVGQVRRCRPGRGRVQEGGGEGRR